MWGTHKTYLLAEGSCQEIVTMANTGGIRNDAWSSEGFSILAATLYLGSTLSLIWQTRVLELMLLA